MIQHYIKVALRLIERSMLFSLINMLGFVFGMAAAFLIYLWVVNELTYEDYNPDTDRIYRVVEVVRQQTGEITDHEWQIIICAAEMTLDVFPFLTNTNMLNTHLSSWIHRNLGRSCKRTWIGLQILAWVDCIF